MNEKIEFSNRLRAALVKAGYVTSPSVLEHEFNLRWYASLHQQSGCLGLAEQPFFPTQEKLQVLAEWLRVEPQVLRVGEAVRNSIQVH